ncbi:VOC family protein [Lentisalinibacter salinarum]|uniref:VOC family protein n=1 Tax=Lentisalinibacter salinarum TaxID=2992239 RepID=UPI003870089D
MAAEIEFDGGLTLSVPVSDLDRSIAWYRDTLGLELIYRLEDMGWCEMVSPVTRVNVGLSVVEAPSPGGATPTFGVKDIRAAKASLEERGVRIDGDVFTIEGMVHLLTFYDPDDNSLMFYQDIGESA